MNNPRQFLALLIAILVIAGIISSARTGHAEDSTNASIAKAGTIVLQGGPSGKSLTGTPTPSPLAPSMFSAADEPDRLEPVTIRTEVQVTVRTTRSNDQEPTVNAIPRDQYDSAVIAETKPQDTVVSPTPSMTPSPPPTPTPLPTSTPTPISTPLVVNGISSHDFIVIDDLTRLHMQKIFSKGQILGRNPQGLSRIGASIIETDQFLVRFGTGDYDLGPFSHLQPVVDFFSPSFERYGVGIRRGLTSWMVIDPDWSDRRLCQADESMLACEIRLNNPSVLLLVLGTNDIGEVGQFDSSMRQIVSTAIEEGVIPILSTKADRYEGGDNRNNEVIHQIAADFQIPLWDFDLVSRTLPGQGLARDNVHLTFLSEFDYNLSVTLQRGYGLFNLTVLMVLDEVWHEMKEANL